MRYSLFDTKAEAESYKPEVQAACDAAHVPDTPKVVVCIFYKEWLGKWVTPLPTEPAFLRGDIVDGVEQPSPLMGEI